NQLSESQALSKKHSTKKIQEQKSQILKMVHNFQEMLQKTILTDQVYYDIQMINLTVDLYMKVNLQLWVKQIQIKIKYIMDNQNPVNLMEKELFLIIVMTNGFLEISNRANAIKYINKIRVNILKIQQIKFMKIFIKIRIALKIQILKVKFLTYLLDLIME
ncbi:hypothetical protein IMG5_171020, partial [Ichthyophthirius multifiliis]